MPSILNLNLSTYLTLIYNFVNAGIRSVYIYIKFKFGEMHFIILIKDFGLFTNENLPFWNEYVILICCREIGLFTKESLPFWNKNVVFREM